MDRLNQRLAEIKARLAATTPGPWEWNSYGCIEAWNVPSDHSLAYHTKDEDGWVAVCDVGGGPTQHGDELHHPEARANADFIAHAPEDIALLLDVIEAAIHSRDFALDNHGHLRKRHWSDIS